MVQGIEWISDSQTKLVSYYQKQAYAFFYFQILQEKSSKSHIYSPTSQANLSAFSNDYFVVSHCAFVRRVLCFFKDDQELVNVVDVPWPSCTEGTSLGQFCGFLEIIQNQLALAKQLTSNKQNNKITVLKQKIQKKTAYYLHPFKNIFGIDYYRFDCNKNSMQKNLKQNKSVMSLSNNISLQTNTDSKHHHLIRRKFNGVANIEKRNKSKIQAEIAPYLRYIPINKPENINKSTSFRIQRKRSKDNLLDNTGAHDYRRFQRNASQTLEVCHIPETSGFKDNCKIKRCCEEKNSFAQTIIHLKSKNEGLQQQKLHLMEQLSQSQEKIKQLQEKLSEKALKSQQLQRILMKRQATCNKMHQTINQKYRQISKLQDIISKLQKQIMSSNNPQSFTPLSLQSSRIINQLTSKLKYKEIENHLLKKQKFDLSALQEQVRVLTKENNMLKDRVNYYIRLNGRHENDSCSSESLSLELSEVSPLKKKSISQISSNSKVPSL